MHIFRSFSKYVSGMLLAFVIGIFAMTTASAENSTNTLERILDTGKLRIGYRTDSAPFSYRDETGNAAGYTVELCGAIVAAIRGAAPAAEMEVEYIAITGDRFQELEDGRVDLLCAGDTVTLGRRETVSFSIPVFFSGVGALLRTDAPADLRALMAGEDPKFRPRWRASYNNILKERTFVAVSGTTAESWAVDELSEFNVQARINAVANNEEGMDLVVKRKADAFVGDRAILLAAHGRSGAAKSLYVVTRRFTYESIAVAVPRGDEDFRLLVDRALSELYRSEKGEAIYKAHFGEVDEIAEKLFSTAALTE